MIGLWASLYLLGSSDDEVVGYIGMRVLRFGAGGLTGLWSPNCQTWHFSQIDDPLPTLGHCHLLDERLCQTWRWSELR